MSDALLNDPGWVAVGPDHAGRRHMVERLYHRAALEVTARWGRPIYGAFVQGRLAGVAATFAAGRYPPPGWTLAAYVPAFLLAGAAAIERGLRTASVQDGGHPQHEHVFLWFLTVDPARQRQGVGRALLSRVIEDAEAPVYLDTTNPGNLPYYASFGFEISGQGELPRETTMWFMTRP